MLYHRVRYIEFQCYSIQTRLGCGFKNFSCGSNTRRRSSRAFCTHLTSLIIQHTSSCFKLPNKALNYTLRWSLSTIHIKVLSELSTRFIQITVRQKIRHHEKDTFFHGVLHDITTIAATRFYLAPKNFSTGTEFSVAIGEALISHLLSLDLVLS